MGAIENSGKTNHCSTGQIETQHHFLYPVPNIKPSEFSFYLETLKTDITLDDDQIT